MTPGIVARSIWASMIRRRGHTSTWAGRPLLASRRGLSVVTMIFCTPSASSSLVMSATPRPPATGCPPVMATVELTRSLKVMFTLESTAARIARDPEWANVPSPMFWTKCGDETKGDMPFHMAPSPPIWKRPTTVPTWRGSIWMARP